MMRNGDFYGIAIRKANGDIFSKCLPWRSLVSKFWLSLPLIRGFPILLETLINGIQALNLSVSVSEDSPEPQTDKWQLAVSLFIAILMAIGLFVVAPHLLSLLMLWIGLGGDVEGLSFHLWDGFYKCAIFIFYIWLISLVPEIRRVFEYHGAEHKTIHAWEKGLGVNHRKACAMSRLHPRCGTTFLLFVICLSIILQALFVPLLLKIWSPDGMALKHAWSVFLKLLLVIPISAIAYELIRFAARLPQGFWSTLLQSPGLGLQKLTTREPSAAQLEVAAAALNQALQKDTLEYID